MAVGCLESYLLSHVAHLGETIPTCMKGSQVFYSFNLYYYASACYKGSANDSRGKESHMALEVEVSLVLGSAC